MQLFADECVFFFAFNAEIQDGHQKWRENKFWEKSPVDSADILQVKNFADIVPSHTVIKINAFLCLRRNSRWPPKMVGKLEIGHIGMHNVHTKGSMSFALKFGQNWQE